MADGITTRTLRQILANLPAGSSANLVGDDLRKVSTDDFVQSGTLSNVAFTGNYADLIGKPSGGGTGTVTSVGFSVPTGFSITGSPVTVSGTLALSYAAGYQGYTSAEATKLAGIATGATANAGTVTSVALTVPNGLTVSGSPVSTSGTLAVTYVAGYQAYTTAEATKLGTVTSGADPTGATINSATAKTTPVDADVMALLDSAASNVLKKVTWSNLKATLKTYLDTLYQPISAGTSLPTMIVRDEKSSGTDGGSPSSPGAFLTRDLNTIDRNSISGASLASNVITLPAGTYQVIGSVPAANCNGHQARIWNITDGVSAINGTSARSGSSSLTTTESFISGSFTISSTKTFRLEHWCSVVGNYGYALGGGTVEIYSELVITKVA